MVKTLNAETSGKIEIPLGERVFTLRARADRIEQLAGRRLRHPRLQDRAGRRPRSRCASASRRSSRSKPRSCAAADFADIAAGASVARARLCRAARAASPRAKTRPIEFKEGDADVHADRALAKLQAVVARFEDEQQPYLPLVLSMWKNRYGTYDHLARVKEWSVGGTDEEDGMGGGE